MIKGQEDEERDESVPFDYLYADEELNPQKSGCSI